MRRSRQRPEGYLSNGCINCDALQGSFPLHEDLMEFLAEGGEYEQLIVARWRIPRRALADCVQRSGRDTGSEGAPTMRLWPTR
jgi:hypothetical protein